MHTQFSKTKQFVALLLLFLLTGCIPALALFPNKAEAPVAQHTLLSATLAPMARQAEPILTPLDQQAAPTSEPTLLSTPTPDLLASPAPLDADPRQAALLQFILDELAGTEKQHLLVAYVKANPSDSRAMLNLAEENILRAWVFQNGSLHDSSPANFTQHYTQEPNGAWRYAYLAFSLNQVDPDFTSATLRIDHIPGLAGGKGLLFELICQGKQWSVKRQHSTWIQ